MNQPDQMLLLFFIQLVSVEYTALYKGNMLLVHAFLVVLWIWEMWDTQVTCYVHVYENKFSCLWFTLQFGNDMIFIDHVHDWM